MLMQSLFNISVSVRMHVRTPACTYHIIITTHTAGSCIMIKPTGTITTEDKAYHTVISIAIKDFLHSSTTVIIRTKQIDGSINTL